MAYNDDSSGSGHDEPWIQWFCGLKGHEMFCEVERSYIEDGFNLYGLRACVSSFSDCLDLILDRIGPDDSDDSHLTQNACTLYGLIHARYIITAHGLDAMYNKYAAKEFGTCPLLQCAGQPVLPLGLRDEMGVDTVKIFCPKCQCVYHPPPVRRSSHSSLGAGGVVGVDGASFGTTFPHLFLMTFSNLVPDPLPTDSAYTPRVFGFRIHSSARQRTVVAAGPQIQMNAAPTRRAEAAQAIQEGKADKDENDKAPVGQATAVGPLPPTQDSAFADNEQSAARGFSGKSSFGLGNSSVDKKLGKNATSEGAGDIADGGAAGIASAKHDDSVKQQSSAKKRKTDGESAKSASAGESNKNGTAENKMKRPKRPNGV